MTTTSGCTCSTALIGSCRHGWYALPPLHCYEKGDLCLTCSLFVTDQTDAAAAPTTRLAKRSAGSLEPTLSWSPTSACFQSARTPLKGSTAPRRRLLRKALAGRLEQPAPSHRWVGRADAQNAGYRQRHRRPGLASRARLRYRGRVVPARSSDRREWGDQPGRTQKPTIMQTTARTNPSSLTHNRVCTEPGTLHPLVGTNHGHQWGVFVTASGEIS